ncbi:2Fe-2S iron-sulfur cluster-binding protein [Alkalihalobacillus deserti]|uniref:2Fe-2S iron-sulfur cluster-binding protein n=1 Tax=Alkalihalobacillus deserti TaxID=2879466 RepID=UPI001D153D98|nr:2Fe-2S iron-sulfur cluster-binding protein [Alkalihalobacillus deserti]
MISRKLTVGSLKEKAKAMPDHSVIQKTVPSQLKRKPEKRAINKIKIIQNNKNYTVISNQKKSSLLDLALEQSQMLSYKCKKGSCGKCMVEVLSGASCLEAVTKQERETLKGNLERNYRLSCQAIVNCK